MGIGGVALEKVDYYVTEEGKGGRFFRRFNTTFLARCALRELDIHPNPNEVEAVEWASYDRLFAYLNAVPPAMTAGLSP